jgi:hypothetical protein
MSQDLSFILPLPIIRILGLSCTQIGLFAYSENCQLRMSSEKIASLSEHYDFLVALEANDISEYQPLLKKSGIILYNENTIHTLRVHPWYDEQRTYIPIALDSFSKIWGPIETFRPFTALGAIAALIGLDIESLFYYLPTDTAFPKTTYQDCITAGLGYIRGLDRESASKIKPIAYDSSRLYISGFDAVCLALRKVDHPTIANPHPEYNAFGTALTASCKHYDVKEQEGSSAILAPFALLPQLQKAYHNHVIIVHHHDETALFRATTQSHSYLASDLASLYSHIYLAMLKQELEHTGTTILVADHVLMGYQTLAELPIPSEHLYEAYHSYGSERAKICILSSGSSKGVITESQDLLKQIDISTRYIQLNHTREMNLLLNEVGSKCELLLIATPLSSNEFPPLSTPYEEINEWQDAEHLSKNIQKLVTSQNQSTKEFDSKAKLS